MAEYTCHGCGERRIFGVKHVCFSRVALPPASLGDEERARLWALERTHDKSWTFEMLYEGALWGLRTSRAELLAEREKVRCLSVAVEKARFLSLKPHRKITEQSGIFTILDQALKETE